MDHDDERHRARMQHKKAVVERKVGAGGTKCPEAGMKCPVWGTAPAY
ncbi:MAG: hypothetical protein Q8J96_09325 [Rhodocyclaceae bacterium]|nr:hypothetical protein [Rhodocyclaceae bacterium]